MNCKIADLLLEVPEAGGFAPRYRDYLMEEITDIQPDIVVRESDFDLSRYPENINYEALTFMESGRLFHINLLKHNGISLHASAVEYEGRVYLFSAPSGTGKSTHTGLWQKVFGPKAMVINDDKPALRLVDGTWYAYGTPWCGKGTNINRKAPIAGICFLKQAKENKIRRLSAAEAVVNIIWQTTKRMDAGLAAKKLELLNKLLQTVPVFELENNMALECVHMSHDNMLQAAIEAGLPQALPD